MLYSHVCLGALLIVHKLPDLVLRGSLTSWIIGMRRIAWPAPLYHLGSALVSSSFLWHQGGIGIS